MGGKPNTSPRLADAGRPTVLSGSVPSRRASLSVSGIQGVRILSFTREDRYESQLRVSRPVLYPVELPLWDEDDAFVDIELLTAYFHLGSPTREKIDLGIGTVRVASGSLASLQFSQGDRQVAQVVIMDPIPVVVGNEPTLRLYFV